MNLKQLREKGGFVSVRPVKKSVVWKHADDLSGEEHTDSFDVHVVKLSFGMVERIQMGVRATDENDQRSANAQLISEATRWGEDGKERMSYQEAYQLQPKLARALVIAIAEVNALPKPKEPGEEPEDPKA